MRNQPGMQSAVDELAGDDPAFAQLIAEARVRHDIAQLVYDAREAAGLSQGALANLVGTRPSIIEAIEASDYHGNLMQMLWRITRALNLRLQISVLGPGATPAKRTRRRSA